MSRLVTKIVLASFASSLLFASAANAGNKNEKSSNNKNRNGSSGNVENIVRTIVDHAKKEHKEHKFPNIDPGRGDGKETWKPPVIDPGPGNGNPTVITTPKTVRDHRGNGQKVVKLGDGRTVIVTDTTTRDHRTNAGQNPMGGVTVTPNFNQSAGGVTVGGPTSVKTKHPVSGVRPAPGLVDKGGKPAPFAGTGAIIRDHRGNGKPNDVIGVGPGPGHVVDAIGVAIGEVVGAIGDAVGADGTITPVKGDSKPQTDYHLGTTVRDHRDVKTPYNGGTIIRDHRK